MPYAIVNGVLFKEDSARVSVFERGYLYGDGVFDTMRSYEGRIFRFQDHFERLSKNICALGIEWEMGAEELRRLILRLLKKNRLSDACIRVSVSRGKAGFGPRPLKGVDTCYSIVVRHILPLPPNFYRNGVEIMTSSVRRFSASSLDGKIKSMNYLNSILARERVRARKIFETVLLSEDGLVVEGTFTNIFIVKDNKVITPPSFLGALEGITRKVVLEIADIMGIEIELVPFTPYELYTADECFLTSTGIEVMPVKMVDGRIIGKGKPGDITETIKREFVRRRAD